MNKIWTLNDLNNDLKELTSQYSQEKNPYKKEKLSEYIWICKNLIIAEELGEYEQPKLSKNDIIKDLLLDFPIYQFYHQYILEFKKILEPYEKNRITKININQTLSKTEILELNKSFFKSIGGDIYKTYKNLSNSNYIRFKKTDEKTGNTIFIPGVKKPYITISDSDEIFQLPILAHESGHAIGALINNDRYTENAKFAEIESLFFEMLSYRYYGKKLKNNLFYRLEEIRMEDYFNDADDTLFYKDVYEYISNSKDKNYKNIIANSKKQFDRASIKYFFKTYENSIVTENIEYLFSYIVAIELLEEYEKDQEKALYKLNRIITSKIDEETKTIFEEVNPNESLEKHIQKIRKLTNN